MKIPLTISEDYCADWGLFEGVREFMQNARDAVRAGCSFDAFYHPDESRLVVKTRGAVLEHKTLLLGKSTKRGRADMLGEQGEGYKIGSLVLCRMGKKIKIRTGSEVWKPELEFSEQFDSRLLTFNISGERKHKDEIVVEINGITKEEWAPIAHRFLFLKDHKFNAVESVSGTVLVEGNGQIFVGGIWVCQLGSLKHGYDFLPSDVSLDRDRRLMKEWDAKVLSAKIWESLYLRAEGDYCWEVDEMLAAGADDVEHFRYDWCVGQNARKLVASRFQEKFGEKSLAVRTESEARELEFYGRRAEVVSSDVLRDVVEREVGTIESVRHSMEESVKREYSVIDITPEESKNLLASVQFVAHALDRKSATFHNDITIVDFMNPKTIGMRKKGKIYISRNCLSSFEEALKTVVEEVAHEVGADGTHDHVEMIHEIYAAGIYGILQRGKE